MFSFPKWNIQELTGYVPQTTFWMDFSIADRFGKTAIQDTFNRAFAEWKNNVTYITELVMVLNHKCWYFYEKQEMEISKLYCQLYEKAHDWALDNLKGDELGYYLSVTD